jgi:hypothetical protein
MTHMKIFCASYFGLKSQSIKITEQGGGGYLLCKVGLSAAAAVLKGSYLPSLNGLTSRNTVI